MASDKKKIILLTTEPESFVQEKFKESAENSGFEFEVVNPDECYVTLDVDSKLANNGAEFAGADVCIPRLSEDSLDYKVAIMQHIEKLGVYVLNTGRSMRTASNKVETQILLNDDGIKTPKSAMLINIEQLETALEAIGGKFPVIVKTIFGTHGIGVIRADSMASLKSIAQQLIKSGEEFMIQEYIEHEESARILVLGDEAIAAVLRTIPPNDFRSNAHQGAELKKYDPSDVEKEICLKASKLIGTNFAAVDYITTGEGDSREVYILEINGSPGFEAMQEVIDFNIADKVIEFVKNELNGGEEEEEEEKEPQEKSEEETDTEHKKVEKLPTAPEEEEEVESEEDPDGNETEDDREDIESKTTKPDENAAEGSEDSVIEPEKIKVENDDFNVVGAVDKIIIKYFNDEKPIETRIDTGAEYSSINGSDIELTDETISFTFGDYRYRFSLLKNVNIVAANGKEKRPIIRLDIVINDNTLHNVEFTVNDRGELNFDVLLGRRALAQANVLVNPAFVHLSSEYKGDMNNKEKEAAADLELDDFEVEANSDKSDEKASEKGEEKNKKEEE